METAVAGPYRLTVALIALIAVCAAIAFWPILDAVILALSLAIVTIPLYNIVCRGGVPEWISASIVTVIVAVLMFGAGIYMAYVLYTNVGFLNEMYNTIFTAAQGFRGQNELVEYVFAAEDGNESTDFLITLFRNSVSSLPIFVIKVVIFFLSLYMFYFAGENAWRNICSVLPGRMTAAVNRMAVKSVDTMYAVWVVHIATAVITFFLALPFFYFMGYDHILFFATITALFQLIPIIGPTLIMIFIGAYMFALGDYRGVALVAFIGYPVVCAFPDLILRPMMMGKRAAIHPVLMWIGFFGGMAAMGLIGFVLGPLFIALGVTGYRVLVDELNDPESSLSGMMPGKQEG